MRQLIQLSRKASGFTLIELMVTIAIAGLLATLALPNLMEYMANSRLHEAANVITNSAMFARSEAVKANATVSVGLSGRYVQVVRYDPATAASAVVRSSILPEAVAASGATATFDSTGRLTPFGTDVVMEVTSQKLVCSGDIRCPKVHMEASGATTLCTTGVCP